jgi:sugar lactone lactonase YvrE
VGGTGVGQFNTPCGLAFDSQGRVYVADRGNHRIVRADDVDGAGWATLGTPGAGIRQLNMPTDVFLDSSDRLYIADTGNHRIVRVDGLDGTGWTTYGQAGRPTAEDPSAVGKLAEPAAVCIDGTGRVLIADRGNSRIVRVNDLGGLGWAAFGPAPASAYAHLKGPTGVRHDASGALLVADFGGRRLLRLYALGATGQESIVPQTGDEPGLLGPVSVVKLAAMDADDDPAERLLVVDAASRRLLELARDADGTWALKGWRLDVGGSGSRLFGLGIGPS